MRPVNSSEMGRLRRDHVIVLLLASGLGVMAGGLIGPALPGIGTHFGRAVDDLELRLVLTMPALFMAIAAAASATLRAYISHRSALVLALLIYGVAGVAGAIMPNLILLLALRALQGLGTGLMMTTVIAIIADGFEEEQRAEVLAYQAAFMSAGSIVVALIGGLLAALDWRATFLTYGLAFLLVVPAMKIPSPPMSSPTSASPTTNPEKLVITILATAAFIMMVAFYLLPTLIPFLLPKIGLPSPIAAGGALALAMAASTTGSLAYRALRGRIGPATLLTMALACMAVGIGMIGHATAAWCLMLWMVLFGTGMGILLPNLSDTAAMTIHPDRRHVAIGGITMGLFLGQFASSLSSKPALDAGSFEVAFSTAAVMLGGAAVILPWVFAITRHRMARSL
jgi:MFS family permease